MSKEKDDVINELLKRVADLEWEVEYLEKEKNEYKEIFELERKREYHSKFLRDFQKEKGKNAYPDHDEIYKRYDDYKNRVNKAIKKLSACKNHYKTEKENNAVIYTIRILKGE